MQVRLTFVLRVRVATVRQLRAASVHQLRPASVHQLRPAFLRQLRAASVHQLAAYLVLAVGACSCSLASDPGREESAVYQTVVDSLCLSGQVRQVLLEDSTTRVGSPSIPKDPTAYLRRKLGRELSEETLQDFLRQNRVRRPLRTESFAGLPVTLLSERQQRNLLEADEGSPAFEQSYPGALGLTGLSAPGLNRNADQALIYVGLRGGVDAGKGDFVLMRRSEKGWRIERMALAWIK